MIWILIGFFILISSIWAYLKFNPQFGGPVTATQLETYKQSEHWDGKKFVNLVDTSMNIKLQTLPWLLKKQFTDTHLRRPQKPLPVVPFDRETFASSPEKPKFIWYGHSNLLLQINGKNILIDPMFGSDASPIGPVSSRRFSENTLDIIDELPKIDAILLTHDHYDHLDYKSFKRLRNKVNTYFVSLGLARHLERWNLPAAQITEFDWWQEITFEGINLTFTPSRHFSGRGLTDRAKCLWGGWVFQTAKHRIFWSGDGGYGEHFKEIGQKFGPFDWAFMECGQYNENWHQIHLFPEESVQAAIDAGAQISIPVHWGGFSLAHHTWQDPVKRFVDEARKQKHRICTPRIGQIIRMGEEAPQEDWWTKFS